MNNDNSEPMPFCLARYFSIITFLITALVIGMSLKQARSPLILSAMILLYLVSAIGLIRKLAWSYWPSGLLLLLIAFYWSSSLIALPEGSFTTIQKLTKDFPIIALWFLFVGMWIVALGVFYTLNRYYDCFSRKWW